MSVLPNSRTSLTNPTTSWSRTGKAASCGFIHPVCQDWGGLIGLRLLAAHPERFARAVVSNTGLPTGDFPVSKAFLQWRAFSVEVPEFNVGAIVNMGTLADLPEDILRAYDAPFPDETYKEGARVFPSLVPVSPDDPAAAANRRAWEVLSGFEKPFLTAFSDGDPITRGGEQIFQKRVPGAQGPAAHDRQRRRSFPPGRPGRSVCPGD